MTHALTAGERASANDILRATIGVRRREVTPDQYRAVMRASMDAHGARHEIVKAAAFATDDRING